MVMILSGQEPSEMLTRALLCGEQKTPKVSDKTISGLAVQSDARRDGKKEAGLIPEVAAATKGARAELCLLSLRFRPTNRPDRLQLIIASLLDL